MPRDYGEGSVYQRRDGRWVAAVCTPAGRRYYYRRTRKEAVQALKEAQAALASGRPPPTSTTVAQHLVSWLDATRPRLRASTARRREAVARLYLIPHIGRLRLSQLGPGQVQAMLTALLAAGVGAHTVAQCRAVLRAALNQALRWELVSRNVASLTEPPKTPKRAYVVLDARQARALLAAAVGDRWEALFVLALMTGLRQGEILGLRWADIDLDGARLHVAGAIEPGSRLRVLPKTEQSTRTIPLPARAVAALRAQREHSPGDGLVFTTAAGDPVHSRNVSHAFYRLLERANLPRIRYHDLRHTCCSLLLADGVPPRTVMAILGHATVNMTLTVYGHVQDAALTGAMERMGKLLAP